MKNNIITSLALSMAILMVSCGKNFNDDLGYDIEYEAIRPELDVYKTSYSIDDSEQTLGIQINSNSYWTAETKTDWLYLNSRKGKGKSTLAIKVYSNPSTTSKRKGTISVTDGINTISIDVTQASAPEYIALSEDNLSFAYSGGRKSVTVESNSNWTATSNVAWCTVSTNSSAFYVSVESNYSYSPRTAAITVKGPSISNNVIVSQAAVKEPEIGTLTVSNVTKTSADCQFTYDSSDLPVESRGVCYSSTNKEPTISDGCKYSANYSYNSGTSTLSITSLNQNTTYYVRPYVTTSVGTTYGSVVQFTTAKNNSPEEEDNPTPKY